MNQKIPAVSIVLPMYNVEKFIAPCLESLLAQTFKDFEVIVVDHCSTDNSYAVAASYAEKLTGAGIDFHLLHMKKNFGNPYAPRNKGLDFSRGKYVYFMDSDDLLMNNALAELYRYAETYDADVVCMRKHFVFEAEAERPFPSQLKIFAFPYISPELAEVPHLESENLADRMMDQFRGKFGVMPWLKFSRRDLLIENEIYFPRVYSNEDNFWTMHLILSAKRMLIIPAPLYINRNNKNSITRHEKTPAEEIRFIMYSILTGPENIDFVARKNKFLEENSQHRYTWMENLASWGFNTIFKSCVNLNPYEVYEIFREQFAQETGEHTELVSYLCSLVNTQQKMLAMANGRITELEKKLAER